MTDALADSPLVATGIAGFDDILGGGLTAQRMYLVEGNPGAGKTTLGLQFLLEGVRLGERGLYITLSETREELDAVMRSHGWRTDGIDICELAPTEAELDPDAQSTMFHPAEAELNVTVGRVLAEVERVRPSRVVFDSLSELRLLAQSSLRYRRQILALKQFFAGRHGTVLLLDDRTAEGPDHHLHSLAHGVITLEQFAPDYGSERRRLRVRKMRGRTFRDGYHDYTIRRGGLDVYPRLVAAEHHATFAAGQVASGVAGLDRLLGGGPDWGSSTLLMGSAGCGKSSIAVQYLSAAAGRGEAGAYFTFDESMRNLLARADGMNMDFRRHIETGRIRVEQINPGELAPDEFMHRVQIAAEAGARIVIIDSLNGYLNAMPDARFLMTQLHELFTYLGQRGVATFLVMAQHGLVGVGIQTPIDVSYLADNVVLLRYFEAFGRIRRSISAVKRRGGAHEDSIRELTISPRGLNVGEPLDEFQGILTGVPTFIGSAGQLGGES